MQSLGFLVATAAGGSLGIRLLAACPMAMHTNEVIFPPSPSNPGHGKSVSLLWETIVSHEHEHTSKSCRTNTNTRANQRVL